jgi:hypothetical protein
MRVIIKTVKGDTYPIECDGSWTVAQIKAEIVKILSIETDSQKLIFKGKHLEDAKTLEELGVKSEDSLVLMIMKVS